MSALTQDERDIVALTGAFVDERVRPRVRDYEAGDTYPAEFIDETKKLGFFGLLAPAEYGGVDVSATGAARTVPATDGRRHAQGHDGAHRAGRRSDLQAMRTAMQVARSSATSSRRS
ncbi:acyl-CoA dehydrogenase family protein [Nonomuraea turcica]|uniref:acyl-CoA dehydrogenase family protein n=1 Tax=Nonomuraea sp. G32 TaxID=3067274 RepID=UPI00273C8AE1|nr:acyl-CoA dehydrogenase family protein [Nonomuraea sp. G32]MDP4503541.1 acyl-CoA dehydrogenase family protein [Nonomuraea sp. G32]